jgi:hypothetical protein
VTALLLAAKKTRGSNWGGGVLTVNGGGGAQNLWWGKHKMRPAQRSSGGVVSSRGTRTRAHTCLTIRWRTRGSKAGGRQ